MREYARIREVAEGDARPLRQLSIIQYVVEEVPLEKESKKKQTDVKTGLGMAPPIGSWLPSLGEWGRVTWSGGVPYAPPCAHLTSGCQRQQALGKCGFEGMARCGPVGHRTGSRQRGTNVEYNSVHTEGPSGE